MEHIVVIGNGIAGISFALQTRQYSLESKITILSQESSYFFSRPALMYILMGHMRLEDTMPYPPSLWEEQKLDLLFDKVLEVNFKTKTVQLQKSQLNYTKLIIATGSKPSFYNWPGQDAIGVSGFYSLQDLKKIDQALPDAKQAVVVGGGLIGVELAEALHARGLEVHFLVREQGFWNRILSKEEADIVGTHIRSRGIHLHLASELQSIQKDLNGRASSVTTSKGQTITCQIVGICTGVNPQIDLFLNTPIETNRGILIDQQFCTSEKDVYAIGDCSELRTPRHGRSAIEAVWYTAKMQGEQLAHILFKDSSHHYQTGIWFNSAKFFDLEYQTYGSITADGSEYDHFFWNSKNRSQSLRIQYHPQNLSVLGFNFLGIRARHEICEHWINQATPITQVLENLGALNFDPEFFHQHEKSIIKAWNQAHPTQRVELRSKKGLFSKFWKKYAKTVEMRT